MSDDPSPLSDSFDGDLEVIYDGDRPTLLKFRGLHRKRVIICFGVLCLLFFFLCLAFLVIALSVGLRIGLRDHDSHKEYGEPPEYYSWEEMLNTVEFQIALNPKPDWAQREDMLMAWRNSILENTDIFNLDLDVATEEIYRQYHSADFYCGVPDGTRLRLRDYVYSDKFTVDLKRDEGDERACPEPFWPAEQYLNSSRSKCEEDVHPCFDKWSLGVSIQLDYFPTLRNCKEVFSFFPYIKGKKSDPSETIVFSEMSFWWKFQWKGNIGQETFYEINFTLKYHSLEDAISGNVPIEEGEFSLRFYTPHGITWEESIVDRLQTVFYQLVQEYDEYEHHKECATTFLSGKPLQYGGIRMTDQIF